MPTTDKVIFLGIDDGLVRDPALLTLLRKERIPLTLFLVREPAHDGADLLPADADARRDGAGPHDRPPAAQDSSGGATSTTRSATRSPTSRRSTARGPTLFRPPYGEWNETTRSVVAGCGLHALILWRGATNDGRLDIIGGQFHPGDIILMHFRTDLVENLQLVLARAQAEGYKIGRLEDYLGTGPRAPDVRPLSRARVRRTRSRRRRPTGTIAGARCEQGVRR